MKHILVSLWLFGLQWCTCIELTFEMSDQAVECFHEDIPTNTPVYLEFQVIAGGSHDIDCSVKDPGHQYIYQRQRIHLDSIMFTSQSEGTYTICFGNEFSTFTNKVVYMKLRVGEERPFPGPMNQTSVITQIEDSVIEIRKTLSIIEEQQTRHRLREAEGRKRADDLNWKVSWWGFVQTLLVFIVATAQMFIVKNFFTTTSYV